MEWLNNCYSTKVRLWIGGVERIAPITWFWAPSGAQELGILASPPPSAGPQVPLINSYVSNVYAKPREESAPGPGEVNRWRTWADGTNPGYRGLCFLGNPEWFRTGQLPADALAGPALPLPFCCGGVAAESFGGLLLGGSASFPGLWPPQPSGGLLLGGSASFPGLWPPQPSGGLLLGGSALFAGLWPPLGSGGLLLGGSAGASVFQGSGSGSGSGSNDSGPPISSCDQCPDGAAFQYTLTRPALTNGICTDCPTAPEQIVMTYLDACVWQGNGQGACGNPFEIWTFSIFLGGVSLSSSQSGGVYVVHQSGWDCKSPIRLFRTGPLTTCLGWPDFLDVSPF